MDTNLTHLKQEAKNRILLYEDDVEITFMCKLILEKNNYHVETREKCADVIKDINRLKPDLILMDLWIPEMGGEKAVKQVKANSKTKLIPILLFSANSDIKEICSRSKADGYISKPFDIKTLVEVIGSFFPPEKTIPKAVKS